MACRAEDNETVAGKLIEDVNEMKIFELCWDEGTILLKFIDSLILVGHFHFVWISQRSSLSLSLAFSLSSSLLH
jgi:hypothetical protein